MIKKRKCSECGKRRMPAKRSNGRLSTKCDECFGGMFWKAGFGIWFADAAKRQSPDSMPIDDEDIKNIHSLWKECKTAEGLMESQGKMIKIYNYHMCHRDPAKSDDFQGRLTYGNLMIAEAAVNQGAGNYNPIDHGCRVYTTQKPFGTAAKVRQWCRGQYKLKELVEELDLKKHVKKVFNGDSDIDFLPEGVPPRTIVERQLKRFEGGGTEPWRYTLANASVMQQGALVYGIGLGSGKALKPSEIPKDTLDEDDF
jgi:hypothetical protein